MLIKFNEEKWNYKMQETLDKVIEFSINDPVIAILGEKVFTIFTKTSDDIEKLKQEAIDKMKEAISSHPDFDYQPLPENECGLVILNNSVITLLDKHEAKWEDEVPRDGVFELLIYRQMAIEACEKSEVYGLYIFDKK